MNKIKKSKTTSLGKSLLKDLEKNKFKYLMVLPIVVYLLLFAYKPMYGLLIAFKDYRITLSIGEAEWVGLKYFKQFFSDPYCFRLFRNTLVINLLGLVFTFPMPIIFALLLNEVRVKWFKKSVQTISYMPHFISMVIMCGMITNFCSTDGIITNLSEWTGNQEVILPVDGKKFDFLLKEKCVHSLLSKDGEETNDSAGESMARWQVRW